jgi:lipopolysaccharide/colanic/teichoic acid biosynthesis glycosyltransferase
MAAPHDPAVVTLSVRVYRALLVCYPPPFRQAYGPELVLVFRDYCRDAYRRHGTLAVVALWPTALADLAWTAWLEWLVYRGGTTMIAKRAFDLAVATVLLLLTAPLQLVIAVMVRLDSHGAALYREPRLGRGGRQFMLLKFRTMTTGTSPTVTRVGQWLRRTNLDELPQLLNIVRGEMSLVGPRPPQPEIVNQADTIWQRLLTVAPGVVGPGQLVRATGVSLETEWVQNLAYVEQHSVRGDLRILAQKLVQLLHR